MSKEVYLLAGSLRFPGIRNLEDISGLIAGNQMVPGRKCSILSSGQYVEFGDIGILPDTPFFPQRQDAKIMRKDVLSAAICAGELMDKSKLPSEIIPDISLFLSSGVFVENLFNDNEKMTGMFRQALRMDDGAKKREMLFKVVPPLLALSTLTNAASSYTAQYGKMAGRNATFGNTSVSGTYSLMAASDDILQNGSDLAVAGGTNKGELYSYATFNRFFAKSEIWRESTGAILFLLSDENYLNRCRLKPLCKIEEILFSKNLPSLTQKAGFSRTVFKDSLKDDPVIVFSGAHTDLVYKQQLKVFEKLSARCFSWFPFLGNAGPANIFLNILAATSILEKEDRIQAFCIDKDPFGRESCVHITVPPENHSS